MSVRLVDLAVVYATAIWHGSDACSKAVLYIYFFVQLPIEETRVCAALSIMPLFSRNKSNKDGSKNERKQKTTEPAASKPGATIYKHIPKHAAVDSSARAPGIANVALTGPVRPPNFMQAKTHGQKYIPSHGISAGHCLQGLNSSQGNHNAEIFVTDPNAPPMPSICSDRFSKVPQPRAMINSVGKAVSKDYLKDPSSESSGRDSQSNSHQSADSGYGSTAHSRATSEAGMQLQDNSTHAILHCGNDQLVPELNLSDELANDPVWSHKMSGKEQKGQYVPTNGAVANSKNNKGHCIDAEHDAHSVNSSKSIRLKKTRFDEPELDSIQSTSHQHVRNEKFQGDNLQRRGNDQNGFPESAILPTQDASRLGESFTSPVVPMNGPHSSSPKQIEYSSITRTQAFPQSEPSCVCPSRTSTPTPGADRDGECRINSLINPSSPVSQRFPPLEKVEPGHHASWSPPVRILEGYKINRQGMILNEEGDTIGELYEGDIIDCVRQRVNGFGEILNDYGRIVGRARTVSSPQQSLCTRTSSPPSLAQTPTIESQQSSYFQWITRSPMVQIPRREISNSRPESFTPAWQQPSNSGYTSLLVNELREYLAASQGAISKQPATSLPLPNTTPAVELDANPSEELIPVIDLSEAFIPQSTSKFPSTRLSKTPSPTGDRVGQTAAESEHEYTQLMPPFKQSPPKTPPPFGDESSVASITSNSVPSIPHQAQPPRHSTSTALLRISSSGSGTDQTKSYARPSMSPVPEDSSLQGDSQGMHSMFAYRGEIPSMDGPVSNSTMAPYRVTAVRSSPIGNFQNQRPSHETQGNTAFVPKGSTLSSLNVIPRQYKGVPGVRPNYMHKSSLNAPLKRSPLRSPGTTPHESDAGLTGGKSGINPGLHLPQPMPNTIHSSRNVPAMNSTAKPRQYFSHAGRITIDCGQNSQTKSTGETAEPQPPKPSTELAATENKRAKKRNRFSLSFGKSHPVMAH
ncbi:MAG: hypothetical protein FE78DRAFT_543940 [Acidomyces sp. 'richmondensis']|nr:MAG: hypothetical protein FE78DRAFT_543940 [Acidomyces sp. 'richmondensis']